MPYKRLKVMAATAALCGVAPVLALAAVSPIQLTAGSYNQDVVVELGASDPAASVTARISEPDSAKASSA